MRLLFLTREHYPSGLLKPIEQHIQLSISGKSRPPERAFAGTTVFYVAVKVPAGTTGVTLQLPARTLLLVLNGQSATRWAFGNDRKQLNIPPFAFFAVLGPAGAIEVQPEQGTSTSTAHCIGFSHRAIPLLAKEFDRFAELAATTEDTAPESKTLPHRFLPYTVYKYLDRLHTRDKLGFALNVYCKEALYQVAKLYHTNLMAATPKPRVTQDEDRLRQAEELIRTHFADPTFNVDSLAQDVGLSRRNLYRLFENQEKSTPQKLILVTRLERAHELLKNNDHSVGDVATMVGFNHPSYFATQYKAAFGHLPNEHR
ncbi:AraC family transcriptional regulator [Parapedobacter sp. 10938]|uniref:AraC family transcriptional regulator n=1 Tax=Parapedobacter flavus TaxID=3110225 RepID=UPI002DB8E4B5|nr:AraC family transcriptional regulator [Parapedobacter sp. 10938]MEC3881393.1 AraC family transcriptional regulator [Parapedobacter sp. 10938]